MGKRKLTTAEKIQQATGKFKLAYIARLLEMNYTTLWRRININHFTDEEVEILRKEGIIQ